MYTNVGLNMYRDALLGIVTDLKIKYIAWGDDSTAPAKTDTQLYNETGRKAITSQAAGGAGVLDTIVYLDTPDAVGTIREIAFFAGASASSTPNSGIMVTRILYSKIKTALEAIQIDLKDTIKEA